MNNIPTGLEVEVKESSIKNLVVISGIRGDINDGDYMSIDNYKIKVDKDGNMDRKKLGIFLIATKLNSRRDETGATYLLGEYDLNAYDGWGEPNHSFEYKTVTYYDNSGTPINCHINYKEAMKLFGLEEDDLDGLIELYKDDIESVS